VTHFGEAFRAHVDAPRPSESGLEETEDEDIRVCVRVCVGGGRGGKNIRAFTSVWERRAKSWTNPRADRTSLIF